MSIYPLLLQKLWWETYNNTSRSKYIDAHGNTANCLEPQRTVGGQRVCGGKGLRFTALSILDEHRSAMDQPHSQMHHGHDVHEHGYSNEDLRLPPMGSAAPA